MKTYERYLPKYSLYCTYRLPFVLTLVLSGSSNDTCSYCGGQVAASVSADPAQAADNIEHLELELHDRRRERERGVLQMTRICDENDTVENR